ncbi:MAG: hypothetical protein GTO24_15460 [candidate division Zixibacteria bacterium]|nr:hypothetical protein [candidate division Zixibacteria bacterium]
MGLMNCAIAVTEDKVAIVSERPLVGLDSEELEGRLTYLAGVADDLDDKLADEFDARIYSQELG